MLQIKYRIADKNVNVRNSRATTVSHLQFRMRREREPLEFCTKWLLDFQMEKKENKLVKLYCREKYDLKSSKLRAVLCGYHHCNF